MSVANHSFATGDTPGKAVCRRERVRRPAACLCIFTAFEEKAWEGHKPVGGFFLYSLVFLLDCGLKK